MGSRSTAPTRVRRLRVRSTFARTAKMVSTASLKSSQNYIGISKERACAPNAAQQFDKAIKDNNKSFFATRLALAPVQCKGQAQGERESARAGA